MKIAIVAVMLLASACVRQEYLTSSKVREESFEEDQEFCLKQVDVSGGTFKRCMRQLGYSVVEADPNKSVPVYYFQSKHLKN